MRRFRQLPIVCAPICLLIIALAGSSAFGTFWYVSPSGVSGNAGTQSSPWDMASAFNGGHSGQVHPGDTIYMMDGNYWTRAPTSTAARM